MNTAVRHARSYSLSVAAIESKGGVTRKRYPKVAHSRALAVVIGPASCFEKVVWKCVEEIMLALRVFGISNDGSGSACFG